MQNQICNVLQYLFSHTSSPLDLLLFPKKSIPVFTVAAWGGERCRTCHLQIDSCSKHMSTLKCCHWKGLGCSHSFFLFWPSTLAWVSFNQGGSPFCWRSGFGAKDAVGAEAVASSTSISGHVQPLMDHYDVQPGTRSSCSDICLLLWWQPKSQRLETPWWASAEVWESMAMLGPGLLPGFATHLTLNAVHVPV